MKCASILNLILVARPFAAASIATRQTLEACAKQVLLGSDAAQRIVKPQDSTYTDARLGEKVQFEEFPSLIAYAKDVQEVAPLIKCAQSSGIKAVPRSGGHHFEAYSALSDTLVVDISHLNYVNISSDHSTATVGAGIRLGALYTALNEYDTSFVGGICPTVGLSGLLGAGGFNMQMRALGLSSDHVQSAKVVVANGTTLDASSSSNPDLFWAIRGGGGGTYGIVTEFTLTLTRLPRSSMVLISWNDTNNRFDVAKRFLDWGPRQKKEFTSQINVYRSTVQVLGWYLGGSQQQLQEIVNNSGLLQIGQPQLQLSGNCGTDNSRLFGYTTTECVPDDKVDASILNVIPDPFSQYENFAQFKNDETPVSNSRPIAEPWARFRRMAKSFFVQKNNLMSDDVLRDVVDRIGQLDNSSQVWGEWHAWNISATGDNAFAWRDQAYAHLEFQVHGSTDPAVQAKYKTWFEDLEEYLRPAVGPASYAGYMDSTMSTNHLQSYYGENVCRLVGIKKTYDPDNYFTNPDAIEPTPPSYLAC